MNFAYIDLDTGAFPLYQGDIRWQNPEIPEHLTGDAFPCPPRYARVIFDPASSFDVENERLEVTLPPVFDGNQWRVSYTAVPLTGEEKAERARMRPAVIEQRSQPVSAQPPSVALTYID